VNNHTLAQDDTKGKSEPVPQNRSSPKFARVITSYLPYAKFHPFCTYCVVQNTSGTVFAWVIKSDRQDGRNLRLWNTQLNGHTVKVDNTQDNRKHTSNH